MHESAMTTRRGAVPQARGGRASGRADETAGAPPENGESNAIRGFVDWFNQQHAAGHIAMPVDRMLHVQPALSAQFCVGLHDLRYFVGVPASCLAWFSELPWACVAIDLASNRLSFICSRAEVPGLVLPAFALSFDVHPVGYTKALSNYHFLDVRSIDTIPVSSSLRISREVHLTASIRVGDALSLLSALSAEPFQ